MRRRTRRQNDGEHDGSDDAGDNSVRVRGIYATALTKAFLDTGWTVVDASPPIQRRFDADFEAGPHAVSVETTADRQGVGIAGSPDAVTAAAELLTDFGRDTCCWVDPAPAGAGFDGRVSDTHSRGATVDLGEASGYLPFDAVDDHIETGDTVRVQVRESAPPWRDDRRRLGGQLQATSALVTLLPEDGAPSVDSHDEAAARELLGMTDLLDVASPDGWRPRWHHAATEASMDDLRAALETATARAERLADGMDDEDSSEVPVELQQPRAGRWCWFGRESRVALDETRRKVTETMVGHHRIKAGSDAASGAVDFVESLCGDAAADGEFPFSVVANTFGPSVGDEIEIGHGKPDGRLISLGTGSVTERDDESITLVREMSGGGSYDGLGVPRSAGDTATTTVKEGRWWYPTVYRDSEEDLIGTYVNICTPVECFPDTVRYIDLHVDVLKYPDGTVERVDDDELNAAVDDGQVSEPLAEKARSVATALEESL
jgi:RNA-binding protein AU-1